RRVQAEVVPDGGERALVGVPARDARGGVDAGCREEDQEREHADREQHEHHRDEAAGDEAKHGYVSVDRSFARGSSASRTPSPSTFSARTVSAIAIPGARATAGRVY